ncbi:hypothetical protein MLD38_016943 [Melastoma candidum]|uniref:Uncharacterized protein n=1 Tax=Melastoma candidum TaxID=119954 RepID=A0ACB9QQX2_9MYRT|nr:hypothetical protein MLD38_016943 [Melastoma candidum]
MASSSLPFLPQLRLRSLPMAPMPRVRTVVWRVMGAGASGDSYLSMWKMAVERERKSAEFERIAESTVVGGVGFEVDNVDKKTEEFRKILEVPKEERDRVQQMLVVDRAAAAIAAARALVAETERGEDSGDQDGDETDQDGESVTIVVPVSPGSHGVTPGPDFWSWTPPSDGSDIPDESYGQMLKKSNPATNPRSLVLEKERHADMLSLPFESKIFESGIMPPLQSLLEVEKEKTDLSPDFTHTKEDHNELEAFSSAHAAEVASEMEKAKDLSSQGVYLDRSRWWKETGVENRPDGVVCRWTMTRGVSADGVVEWQEKFWEASDEFGYKELGSEKSGRDATGNVWREYWRESMQQAAGLVHLEKTADKWGKNGKGEEWQEKWWEHYGASGQAEKWAHKWCSIDPTTPLEAGHAHVWHERWGETYDGHGGSTKYTDKWAERCEGDGWSRWGDKWDENFDPNGHGVKQGETWWEGKHGERWNRTWGEGHNGSGWVHKYGKSSSGEHWDTHQPQETWYERFPHYGFYHCFENSVQLREVRKPSEL